MRSTHGRPDDLRRRIEALPGLPLRPATVRLALEPWMGGREELEAAPPRGSDVDPGFALASLRANGPTDRLGLIGDRPWWLARDAAVDRLWKYGVAAACAARRLASESGRDDPRRWFRIGLLHPLGLWALAATEPARLAEWFALPTARARREAERSWLGTDLSALGRGLAEAWACDPALVDAAWLADDRAGGLDAIADDPEGLDLVQRAVAWARKTPWSPGPRDAAESGQVDPRLRLLVAEVQVLCGSPFVAEDASAHEARVAQAHARLLRQTEALRGEVAARDRFLAAFSATEPSADLETWADRAALAWCSEPGVAAASVDWVEEGGAPSTEVGTESPPTFRLGRRGRLRAEVRLKPEPGHPARSWEGYPSLAAWHAWADLVADSRRQLRRLDGAVEAHRRRAEDEERSALGSRLEALAEFAAGAGHELNNPLAVIQGRAQLLLARAEDAEVARSLRTIVGQAQRAHQMLRDLLYVARPPAPRPRPCQPDEILRAGLADLEPEADARHVRLVAETPEPSPWSWADPEPLRHLVEVLARNALEASPSGATIRVVSAGDEGRLDWTFRDQGQGIDARDGRHLFDPFYCGRQAGRGLGLGLPRAARFLAGSGGELSWKSAPGRGASFHVRLPLPPPAEAEGPAQRLPIPRARPA